MTHLLATPPTVQRSNGQTVKPSNYQTTKLPNHQTIQEAAS
jgi:hypothetical protein